MIAEQRTAPIVLHEHGIWRAIEDGGDIRFERKHAGQWVPYRDFGLCLVIEDIANLLWRHELDASGRSLDRHVIEAGGRVYVLSHPFQYWLVERGRVSESGDVLPMGTANSAEWLAIARALVRMLPGAGSWA